MKSLIRRLLREAFISQLENWETNLSFVDDKFVTLISKDDKTGNKLYLFVGFQNIDKNTEEYTYAFIVLDKNNTPLTNWLIKKDEVAPYIPDAIKNKKLIFPIIIDMTRKLLNKVLPDIIIRKTSEILDSDISLKRYNIIGDILTNEYGYSQIKYYISDGIHNWIYKKTAQQNNNKNMDESYEITNIPTQEDTNRQLNKKFLPIFLEHIKNKSNK